MKLAIIGTAGRGDDAVKLANSSYYRMMKIIAETLVTVLDVKGLVSGGAAFSDHIAVQLFLERRVSQLTLHLPAGWLGHGFKETSSKFDTGRTSNWYHAKFSEVIGVNTLQEIQLAIERGATVKTGAGGFKERNTDIAKEADSLLAFTFGSGAVLKEGGTKDTWNKFATDVQRRFDEAKLHYEESPCGCQNNQPYSWEAYHFDLNSRRLHKIVYTDKHPEVWPEEAGMAAPAASAVSPVVRVVKESDRVGLL